jgi:very-short-patch-repair endonuclease
MFCECSHMTKVRVLRDWTLRDRARAMRSESTRAEAHLWSALRAHRLGGWKWRRQVPKGPYIVDFLCDEARLAVEVDGGQHSDQVGYDERRTAYLAAGGLRVLRFWNAEVLTNRAGVCLTILDALGGDRPGWNPMDSGESSGARRF